MPSAHLSSATRRRVSKEVPTSPAFRKVRSSSARDEVPRDESPSSTIVALSLSRRASSCEYIPLTAAAPWVHNGWCFDSSKSRGHLVLHIGNAHRRPGTQLETFASNLVSNEFWNLVSELCPTLYFCCQTAAVAAAVPGPMTTLRQAVIGTIVSTALQHFCSLVSHACSRQSARMSHAIWYIDYAGILLNFVWNAAPLVYSIEPALERTWPLWLAYNLIATVVLLGGSIHLVCTHRIEPAPGSESGNGGTSGQSGAKRGQSGGGGEEASAALGGKGFFETFFSSPAATCLLVGTLLPGICATIAAGLCGPLARRDNYSSAGLVLPVLCVGLLIKLARLPDRWIGKTFDLSFSPLHSHCLWHCLVWLCQLCYLSYFEQVLEMERRSWW